MKAQETADAVLFIEFISIS